jgi:predicted transcriptional regulator
MAAQKQPENNALDIELSEEIAEGMYSNLAIINHSAQEFVVDFVKMMPGLPKAKVKARIILTPQHAKRFLNAMVENIERYENAHGEIETTNNAGGELPMIFGGGQQGFA